MQNIKRKIECILNEKHNKYLSILDDELLQLPEKYFQNRNLPRIHIEQEFLSRNHDYAS